MIDWDDLISRSELTCPEGGWKPNPIAAAKEAILASAERPVERIAIAESFEGRAIELVSVGEGPKRALLWTQMHGDEPTHTSVLLNLLRLLTVSGGPGESLLAGLTVGLIIPLNPDGAERNTRHNAQGIDVNRDALEFASNEGQALRRAFEVFGPDYAFNLHNQHHRTAIGTPPEPAAVSLLVPPLDEVDTQSDSVKEAVRVAATFCERVRDAAGGRVSRYDADFMARAFGEWVQQRGVPVILVEAGGWPGSDFVVLERIHFAALTQTLEAIANSALGQPEGLEQADPGSYLTLQRSSPYHLFDLLIVGSGVAQLPAADGECRVTAGDLGIDYPHRMAGWYEFRDGSVQAIGDLHENGGLSRIDTDAVVVPGRIALAEEAPDAWDDAPADWDALTAVGVTTALAPIDLSTDNLADHIERLLATPPPLNAALVGRWAGPPRHEGSFLDQLTTAVAGGMTAVVGPLPSPEVADACERLGVPVLDPSRTPKQSEPIPETLTDWLRESSRLACELGWSDRGRVALGVAADLVLVHHRSGRLDRDCLRAVCVGGTVVRDAAGPTVHAPGRWIGGRLSAGTA